MTSWRIFIYVYVVHIAMAACDNFTSGMFGSCSKKMRMTLK